MRGKGVAVGGYLRHGPGVGVMIDARVAAALILAYSLLSTEPVSAQLPWGKYYSGPGGTTTSECRSSDSDRAPRVDDIMIGGSVHPSSQPSGCHCTGPCMVFELDRTR